MGCYTQSYYFSTFCFSKHLVCIENVIRIYQVELWVLMTGASQAADE